MWRVNDVTAGTVGWNVIGLCLLLGGVFLATAGSAAPAVPRGGAAPVTALPDLSIASLRLDETCRVVVTLRNEGEGTMPERAFASSGGVVLHMVLNGRRQSFLLGRIDPDRRLRDPGGRVVFVTPVLAAADGVTVRVRVFVDAGAVLQERDEGNNRAAAGLPCKRPSDDVPADGSVAPPPSDVTTGGSKEEGGAAWTSPAESADLAGAARESLLDPAPAAPFPQPRAGASLLNRPLPPPLTPQSALPETGDPTLEPGEVLVLSADMAEARALAARARGLGLRIRQRRVLDALGMVVTTFALPDGMRVTEGMTRLREVLPEAQRWQVAPNHRYHLLGGDRDPRTYPQRMMGWQAAKTCGAGLRLGMVDTAVAQDHPALASAAIEVRDFVTRGIAAASPEHGTAVASLLVGDAPDGAMRGLVPGARLWVAAVFRQRGREQDTTTAWLLTALDWLAGRRVTVLNLSFGGPRNPLLESALRRLHGRGMRIVAAAGNGGRRAAPVYPAALPEVVAVTAVDARARLWRRANRGSYIEFAAPGVDVWSARVQGHYAFVSGTSYAAPFVTAALALAGDGEVLRARARDLGEPGRDADYGWGLVQARGCGAD